MRITTEAEVPLQDSAETAHQRVVSSALADMVKASSAPAAMIKASATIRAAMVKDSNTPAAMIKATASSTTVKVATTADFGRSGGRLDGEGDGDVRGRDQRGARSGYGGH